MNSFYKQPVIAFGLAAPLLLVFLALYIGFQVRGKFEKTYEKRKSDYVNFKQVQSQREALEKKIREQEPHMNRWMGLYEKPTESSIAAFLSRVQEQYSGQEFQRKNSQRVSMASGIGGASKQPSIQIKLGFGGTFRALQSVFLELETRMPHLQLDSLKLTPSSQNGNILDADVIYTAWQNE